jgi:hypothetical protein
MEIRQADFARLAKVSRATVSGKIKNKTLIVNSAGLLDTDNSVNSAYVETRRRKTEDAAAFGGGNIRPSNNIKPMKLSSSSPGAIAAPGATATTATGSARAEGIPEELLGLTIRELVTRYGNMANVEKYVHILRDLTSADEKDQRIKERRHELVEKDFIISRVFSFLDVLMNQLIDYPESIIDTIVAKIQTSPTSARADTVIILQNGLTGIIGNAKEAITKEINGLKTKYQEDDPLTEIKEKLEEVGS